MSVEESIEQIKRFAGRWNDLYLHKEFKKMEGLATENVGIANAPDSDYPSGLIYGRDNYRKGIEDAYYGVGKDGQRLDENNILEMDFKNWEYISLDDNTFYTIGKYTLTYHPEKTSGNVEEGVNCWLLQRESADSQWRIFRVINN